MRNAALAVGLLLCAPGAWASRATAGTGGTAPAPPTPARTRDVVDALGTRVKLAEKPVRIVTLAPSLGELAADVAGEELERIVGISEFTDYPPGLARATSIGPYHRINIERVVALKPDLVLATTDGNIKDQIEHLRELSLPVVVVETGSFPQVASSMKLVAEAMGQTAAGEKMAAAFEAGRQKIRARAEGRIKAGRGRPRVLLQIGESPLIVAGGRAFLSEALETVGAVNVYGELADKYPRPAMEDALAHDPEWILVLALSGEENIFGTMARSWSIFSKLTAVKRKQIRVLHADGLLRPSLRLLEGLSILETALFGKGKS